LAWLRCQNMSRTHCGFISCVVMTSDIFYSVIFAFPTCFFSLL
jgi:hypothetical protein